MSGAIDKLADMVNTVQVNFYEILKEISLKIVSIQTEMSNNLQS